jgi:hypothetical protein
MAWRQLLSPLGLAALVAELDGVVERLFRGGGASVTLLFPIEASTALLSDGSRVASLQLFDNSK